MAKAKQIRVSPPPSQSSVLQGDDFTSTWKNWFALLYDVLEAQGLVSNPPEGADGTTPGYWHKLYDPAWAHMAITLGDDHTINNGQIITGWTRRVLDDWQLVSSLADGTITADNNDYEETGVYKLSLTGYVGGTKNSSYVFTAYVNGQPTQLEMPLLFGPNTETASLAWSGIVSIAASDLDANKTAEIDIRLTTGGPVTIYTMNWSMHRISPLNS